MAVPKTYKSYFKLHPELLCQTFKTCCTRIVLLLFDGSNQPAIDVPGNAANITYTAMLFYQANSTLKPSGLLNLVKLVAVK